MKEELTYIVANKTWKRTKLLQEMNAISCETVLKRKLEVHNQESRYKARFVVKGYVQMKGID